MKYGLVESYGGVRYYDPTNSTYVGLDAPAVVPVDFTLLLPGTLPTANRFLQVSPAGAMSYTTAVTNVELNLPSSVFTVSGSPVTETGTLTATFTTQNQNQVFASPNGSSGEPLFRGLVVQDFQNLPAINEWATATGNVNLGGFNITNLGTPVNPGDAASKSYVDAQLEGLDPKESVDYYAVSNIASISTASQGTVEAALDPVGGLAPTLEIGDRVLVPNQTNAVQNGIYVWDGSNLVRADDANTSSELTPGAFVFVENGDNFESKGYVMQANPGFALDTDSNIWVQFSDAAAITPGDGLQQTGNVIFVQTVSQTRISVTANGIDLASTGVTPGTYNSLTVDAYGRVTAATLEDDTNSYFFTFTNANLTAGVLSVNHNLNNQYPTWTLADNSNQHIVPDNINYVDANNLQVNLSNYGAITGTYSLELQG